ncbi:uncharacterized protein LOC119576591 [Penaeus monodon]|uniref:uncharacterized protein LOC119576591 n=1 Tax=Penaeus monodon TaxID=6687 RepID=UPI0018A74115|nr:uncharacterized protein LOC119576591 [Penaeus monodon]
MGPQSMKKKQQLQQQLHQIPKLDKFIIQTYKEETAPEQDSSTQIESTELKKVNAVGEQNLESESVCELEEEISQLSPSISPHVEVEQRDISSDENEENKSQKEKNSIENGWYILPQRDVFFVLSIQAEKEYWKQVLHRCVVIKTLSERGLAFRGDSEIIGSPNNGNYLGLLELIAKFDLFLSNHIEKYGNKGTGVPVERFISFLKLGEHTSLFMANSVVDYLVNECGIDFSKCRGQSYDNAANMSGKYNGMQTHILKQNKYAIFVACDGHSLNLIGRAAADCCLEVIIFFGIIQEIYNFFSSSTKRWAVLTCCLEPGASVTKTLSETRWEAHATAVSAVKENSESTEEALAQESNEREKRRHLKGQEKERHFDELSDPAEPEEQLSPQDTFQLKSFSPILEALESNLSKRAEVYTFIAQTFHSLLI